MFKRAVLLTSAVWGFLLLSAWPAAAYDALVAFGDSDTDTGNLPSSPPEYWNGRFSNGPLWVEQLSERLGIPYDPAANFAVSGNEASDLGTQISRFWGPGNAQDVLCAVWAGSNDILNHLSYGQNDAAWEKEINGIVASLTTSCDLLYKKGIRKILLFNLADLTRLPSVRSRYSSTYRTYVLGKIRTCNTRLANAIPGVLSAYPGLEIYHVDLFSDLTYLLDQYSELGFVNALTGALNATDLKDKSFTGPGANYVFWDENHYTTKTHGLIAEWVYHQLPQTTPPPPTVTLTAPGAGASFTAPAAIALSASIAANGNAISRLEFLRDGTLLAQVPVAPYAFTWQEVPAGNYALVARVVDASGRSVESAAVQVSVAPPRGDPLPLPWQQGDIGTAALAGAAYVNGTNNYIVTGSGADIWGTADAFSFAYRPFEGDGQMVARVTSLGNTDGFAKCGIMFRETLAPGSRNAFQFFSASFGTGFQARQSTSGSTTYSAGRIVPAPYWLKLERTGDEFRGYSSADGTTWKPEGSVSIPMGTNIYAGLAVTSHNNALLTTASFESVQLRLAAAPPPPASPALLSVSHLEDGTIRITITGSPGASYVCETSPDMVRWSAISTNVNTAGSYTVLDPGTTSSRYYRAVAME